MNSIKFIFVSLLSMCIIIPVRAVHAHVDPVLLFTPAATISSSETSLFPSISSVTPLASMTPVPTQRVVVITVIHTKIVTAVPATLTSTAGATNTVESTSNSPELKETGPQSLLSIAIIGMAATFIAGIVAGILWSSWRKR
jgi:hypothetical protein